MIPTACCKFFVTVRLEHILHGRLKPLPQRRRVDQEREHAGNPEQTREHLADDLLLRPLTFVARLQLEKDKSVGHATRTAEAETGSSEETVALRQRHQVIFNLPHIAVGVFKGGTFGREHDTERRLRGLQSAPVPTE